MKKVLILLAVIQLTGCYNPPRWLANAYDRADLCQDREFSQDGARLKPQGYQAPDYCGNYGNGPVYVTRGYYNNYPVAKTQAR